MNGAMVALGLVLAVAKVWVMRRRAARGVLDRRAKLTGARPDTLRMRVPR